MTQQYFDSLNYTLANEDSFLEYSCLPEQPRHVVAVAGSGSRVLPLFARLPQRVTVVDLSREQLLLTELRIESARMLTWEEFLSFWGYPPHHQNSDVRRRILSELSVSPDCRSFFRSYFNRNKWESVLYRGKWEQTFVRISRIIRSVLGHHAEQIFESNDIASHRIFMDMNFPRLRWDFLVFLIGNANFFNAMLYRGHFPKKNLKQSHNSFYRSAFSRIFENGLPRDNYFLQLLMLGELRYPQGNPIECQQEMFHKIQRGIRNTEIRYVRSGIVDCLVDQHASPADFVSMSDTPSYFDDDLGLKFLVRMSRGLSSEALVVNRFYLRIIDWMQTDGFLNVTENFQRFIDVEKTQMYHFGIYKKM